METLFLRVLNLSLTASYIIVAVIISRWLLRKLPKKYSFLLWSVVGFRLLSPVSIQSVFSLFSLKPFDLSVAQTAGGAALQFIPDNLGLMARPTITLGIPFANKLINGALPPGVATASVNPIQPWITGGAVLWVLGMAAILVYSLISYYKLRRSMADAIFLADNVYQSDQVRTPFILGFIRPKIYIPFGLGDDVQDYVLAHEAYHLKRRDYLTKLFAFLLLAVHWFNPLCWLAFSLMSRDMEMSCDEKVLAGAGNIRKAYSKSLLSFATNRRLPLPSPLAFGETGIKGRVKNVLGWKTPKAWIKIGATALALLVLAACGANPPAGKEAEQVYVSETCIFMNPLSSYMSFGDSGFEYHIGEDSFMITKKISEQVVFKKQPLAWNWQPLTDEQFIEWLCGLPLAVKYISPYKDRFYIELSEDWILLKIDGEFWVMGMKTNPQMGRYNWDIYSLVPKEDMNSD